MCPQKLCFARALQQSVKMAFANIFPKASSSAEVDLPYKICLYESNSSTAASMERFSSHHKAAWHVGLISAHIWAHQKNNISACTHSHTHYISKTPDASPAWWHPSFGSQGAPRSTSPSVLSKCIDLWIPLQVNIVRSAHGRDWHPQPHLLKLV